MLPQRQILRAVKQQHRQLSSAAATPFVVNSHNEFDPLEEVIVGRVDGATIPEWHVSGKAVWPTKHWDMYKTQSGKPFPAWLMKKGAEELDNFAKILEAEGKYQLSFVPHLLSNFVLLPLLYLLIDSSLLFIQVSKFVVLKYYRVIMLNLTIHLISNVKMVCMLLCHEISSLWWVMKSLKHPWHGDHVFLNIVRTVNSSKNISTKVSTTSHAYSH